MLFENRADFGIFVIVKMNCYGIFRDSFSICRHCTEILMKYRGKIMSGQYKIMYSSMDQFYDQTNGRMAEWVSQLEPWVKACENLGNMECYQGKSAESVKTYLKEVHMTLLTSIQQAIQLYRTKYLFYREGYYDMEGDLYAVIPQKTLLSVKDRMKTEIEDVSDSSLIVQTSLLNVSDLIALQAPNSYYLKDSMEEVKQNCNQTSIKIL